MPVHADGSSVQQRRAWSRGGGRCAWHGRKDLTHLARCLFFSTCTQSAMGSLARAVCTRSIDILSQPKRKYVSRLSRSRISQSKTNSQMFKVHEGVRACEQNRHTIIMPLLMRASLDQLLTNRSTDFALWASKALEIVSKPRCSFKSHWCQSFPGWLVDFEDSFVCVVHSTHEEIACPLRLQASSTNILLHPLVVG